MTSKSIPAIKVEQPLGVFYVFKMKASDLDKITFSSRAKYEKSGLLNNTFKVIKGNQRELDSDREKDIARFINSVESALPNSIILGANFTENGDLAEESNRWFVDEDNNGFCTLHIPSEQKLAAVIDGQHRLAGCVKSERPDIELLCTVYLDLPIPYHAFLFANINANQKKVPRSLAYELYGFGTEEESKDIWSPEKLAVSIVRKLNFSDESMIKGLIILGAKDSENDSNKAFISLASLVDSIMKLFTTNPKKDRDHILYYRNKKGRKTLGKNASLPLRDLYIDGQDDEIEHLIFEFINYIFSKYKKNSYLFKTIGVESLFSILKEYLKKGGGMDIGSIMTFLMPIWEIDFSIDYYTASGIGKSRISNTLMVVTGLKDISSITNEIDRVKIAAIINS
ncbi:DGQHR domain-containing protein [Vibrio vulnificus]|uniref:DGQHR domain-containing protein n=1 Tax=Vibrio vulnificus TaxID=672 RepID=UPI00092B7DA0|nr:DGQHR domain-containing protein [Vibrio vulnificus]EHK9183093.1 DGQHR domain-containing protein [Vibrio vulnificus]EHZ2752756.1 DGQHR domain-containing protein [Vibrio vulnificus]EHZ2761165.1 DGQHR domain-containing protein [Vibrio vulnificus]EKD8801631.1 DGQHR domain-containing protein [Vibrio vulnificus]EKD9319257.1 DGQHR domain-containing protein [Vibrio vulnificus]